jgi:hypothetical protein
MDYKELKRKEFLFEIINDAIDGMDVYNHNGSIWLIKTEELKWAIEFTKDKTLWYNYSLFKNLFKAISLDITENQKYVTEWFESRFLNMSKVEDCSDPFFDQDTYVEETIQSGVKTSVFDDFEEIQSVKDTIQNGVRHTEVSMNNEFTTVEDTIQNGVRQTELSKRDFFPKDILQNGVKETKSLQIHLKKSIEDTIQNGVKDTKLGAPDNRDYFIKDTIENGVKHTDCYDGRRSAKVEYTIQNGVKNIKDSIFSKIDIIKNTIQNGVKKTDEAFYGQVYVEDAIQNGVKKTIGTLRRTAKWGVDDIIQKGVKETHDDCSNNIARVQGIIRIGEKIS